MSHEVERDDDDKDIAEKDRSYLLSYTRHLERKIRTLETEKQLIENERMRMEREIASMRNDLEQMKRSPLITGTIVDALDDGRAVVRSSSGPSFVVNVIKSIEKETLKPNSRVALNQRNFAIVEVLPQQKDPMVSAMEVEDRPTVAYEDIGGLEEQILELRETVELPLTSPELFEKVGISPPKGVMLYGPPGTGKTLLARAVAHETNATFIRVIGSELVQKFIGEGARLVREIFEFAEEKSPTILFIDELDAIGSRRLDIATSGDREVQRTLMQLLSNLDGFDVRGNVRVVAATNRPDILDPALLRPGRFDRVIEIGMPNSKARLDIFKIHSRKMALAEAVDIDVLVSMTEGASGADIRNICMEAGMFAVRGTRDHITDGDFKKAVNKVMGKIRLDSTQNERFFV
ncbi:MAG: proteasome-activating nucleotidase [Candidatus Heimdallarchaeota archaeon]|nr:proteasome-activating nucleotidase [Candidatus Heimdallarchaeota archaeon]MCK4290197.1 proteasome-activating nucleotidase [Candidatus Heimdallarchaeota archaeon]